MYLPAETNENIVLAGIYMGFIMSSCIVAVIHMGFKPLLVKTHVNTSILENNTLKTHAKYIKKTAKGIKKHQKTYKTHVPVSKKATKRRGEA